jgi:hypothetical protein
MKLLPLAPSSLDQAFHLLVSLILRRDIIADLSPQERGDSVLVLQIYFVSFNRRDIRQHHLIHFEWSDSLEGDLGNLEL